jgi:hypothetical protein
MTDTATTRSPRRTPKLVDTTDTIPPSQRNGFWVNEVAKIVKEPGRVFVYRDVSPTTASTLRKDHGLDAHSRTEDVDGEKAVVLYVRYLEDQVEAIKAQVAQRGAKRVASSKANKAKAGQPAKASK